MSSPNPFTVKQPLLLSQSKALITLEASFLDIESQIELNKTCRAVSLVISPQLRLLKSAKLLDHVLNIDEKRKKEILALLQSPDRGPLSFMLMRANGQVKYRSAKWDDQIIPRAEYNNVSPLEAAAECGDFHLLKLFEGALPSRQKHKAGQQLQAVLNNPNFLSAFKTLQNAYHTYIQRYDGCAVIGDWNTIDTLWEQVGEAQKNLSNFGLNVLCNPVPHHPIPDFTQEPQRGMRVEVYGRNGGCGGVVMDLGLDFIGKGTKLALYKGGVSRKMRLGVLRESWGGTWARLDSETIDFLSTVILKELGKITERLLNSSAHQEPEQDLLAGGAEVHRSCIRA